MAEGPASEYGLPNIAMKSTKEHAILLRVSRCSNQLVTAHMFNQYNFYVTVSAKTDHVHTKADNHFYCTRT